MDDKGFGLHHPRHHDHTECMHASPRPTSKITLLDLRAFLIPAYSLQVAGFFLGFMGLYMPFFYAQVYAIQEHITNESLAFYLLAVMNSTSVFGRIVPNLVCFLCPTRLPNHCI